tara:strand:- start:1609 stop:1827 length:219 start_codon:yes stop_codon:yes gene_type:complete
MNEFIIVGKRISLKYPKIDCLIDTTLILHYCVVLFVFSLRVAFLLRIDTLIPYTQDLSFRNLPLGQTLTVNT